MSAGLPENNRPIFPVYQVRGVEVVLDAAVAEGFGLETKRVNEAVSRNPAKFDESHVFVLSDSEWASLRSQHATSKSGRGGARYAPHVFTVKGVARLATVLETPEALRATDLIIDVFLEVRSQIAAGRAEVSINHPSRLTGEDDHGVDHQIRAKLAQAVTGLLDVVIDVRTQATVRQTGQDLAAGALENVRERLRSKGLENAKLEADAALVLAQAEQVYAEVRKTHAEAEGVELENIRRRIETVRELRVLYQEAEPPQMIRLLSGMARPAAALPAPKKKDDA